MESESTMPSVENSSSSMQKEQTEENQRWKRMREQGYQKRMELSRSRSINISNKPIVMIDWRTTVEIIKTYIGIMIVCVFVHYILELIYETIRDSSNEEFALKMADLFQYLDTAFLVSAFIAIIIKAISDTWGVMAYSKIVNQHSANYELNSQK